MSHDDRARWDKSHAAAARAPAPSAPASFLEEHAALLSPGRTLDLAAGAGRNSLFLAGHGHAVIAADLSRAALEAIRGESRSIALVQVDLDQPCFRTASLDNVVCVNFLDRRLFAQIHAWLRPHGTLLLDTFSIDQGALGHPRNPDFLLAHNELLERLRGYRILRYREGAVRDALGLSYRAGIVAVRPGGSEN